jgi:hypothetical protein
MTLLRWLPIPDERSTMSDKLIQSQKLLHDSLFELYEDGGLELCLAGTRGLQRNLIIELDVSVLTPERGEIIHYRAVNRWDEYDEFDDWARPRQPLSPGAEEIVETTNQRLMHRRATEEVVTDITNLLI